MNAANVSTANATDRAPIMDTEKNGRNIAFTVLYSVSMFFAIFGNLFVIFVVFKKRNMKTSTNFMLVNLALADLIVACTIMPFEIAHLNGAGNWVGGTFGDISCKIFFFLSHTTISSSIVTLTLMALDRFLAIMFGFQHIRIFENSKATTGIIWFTSMAIMVPIIPASEPIQENGKLICFRTFRVFGDIETAHVIFYWLVFILLYLIPLLFMAAIYSIIIHKLWFQKIPGNTIDNNLRLVQLRKRNVIRLLVVIVLTFAICWFPAHVLHYYWSYKEEKLPPLVININLWLSQANSSINPCLYIGLSAEFRKAFLQFVQGHREYFMTSIYNTSFNMRVAPIRRTNGVRPTENSVKTTSVRI